MDDCYLTVVEDLRTLFQTTTQNEYKLHNFQEKDETPPVDAAKVENKKLKNKVKTQFELDMIYNKINQISKKTSYRKKIDINQIETHTNQNLLNDPDIFNIVNNEKDYKDWKQLTKEEQLQKAEEFFASTHYLEEDQEPYDEAIKTELLEMIKDGKLFLKKDIEYDKINQRIGNIPLVKFQVETKTYCIKSAEQKKNMRKMSQNAVNKIIKTKR